MPLATPAPTIAPATDAERVAAAVAALGPLDREALLLRLGGRSLDEVAAATGTTTAMVRVRLGRSATAIERRVGLQASDGAAQPDRARPTDEVVTDAEVGITPLLHARLVAALEHTCPPAAPRHRRAAAVLQSVLDHAPQLASLAAVAVWAVVTTIVLAGAA